MNPDLERNVRINRRLAQRDPSSAFKPVIVGKKGISARVVVNLIKELGDTIIHSQKQDPSAGPHGPLLFELLDTSWMIQVMLASIPEHRKHSLRSQKHPHPLRKMIGDDLFSMREDNLDTIRAYLKYFADIAKRMLVDCGDLRPEIARQIPDPTKYAQLSRLMREKKHRG